MVNTQTQIFYVKILALSVGILVSVILSWHYYPYLLFCLPSLYASAASLFLRDVRDGRPEAAVLLESENATQKHREKVQRSWEAFLDARLNISMVLLSASPLP